MNVLLYHGSTYDFDQFDTSKIRANETDAHYNGFWFSSSNRTIPAWTKLNYLYEVEINLLNPAPHSIIREVVNHLYTDDEFRPESRSFADEVRYRLLDMGYDGVIHDDIPIINQGKYEEGEPVKFRSVRGTKYLIHKVSEGCDLYYDKGENIEFITGYSDLDDFLSQQEKTIVAFKSEQIKIINKKQIINTY